MDRLCNIVRSHFRKHWKMIACQIEAVNDFKNLKRGFLFDCGAIDIERLKKLLGDLKREQLVCEYLAIVLVKDDGFILNVKKLYKKSPVVVDVSGSLSLPVKIESHLTSEIFAEIEEQLALKSQEDVIRLVLHDDWSIPTIFGYLINYPAVYFLKPKEDSNNLSGITLKVIQIYAKDELLLSFSVPKSIYDVDADVQSTVTSWLSNFQNPEKFSIKTFCSVCATVVL